MTRTIHLPALDRTVTLAAYLTAIKFAKANPAQEFKSGLASWWPCTGQEIMNEFMKGVHDRINQRIPYHQRGTMKVKAKKKHGIVFYSPRLALKKEVQVQDLR